MFAFWRRTSSGHRSLHACLLAWAYGFFVLEGKSLLRKRVWVSLCHRRTNHHQPPNWSGFEVVKLFVLTALSTFLVVPLLILSWWWRYTKPNDCTKAMDLFLNTCGLDGENRTQGRYRSVGNSSREKSGVQKQTNKPHNNVCFTPSGVELFYTREKFL